MKKLRVLLPSLALAALTATGCFLVSGQFLISIVLDSPLTVNTTVSSNVNGLEIDLSTNSTYQDHKDKIKEIADFALLGTVNNGATAIRLSVYYFDGAEVARPLATVTGPTGIKVWGELEVPASGSVVIDWDRSADLFTAEGKAALLDEIKTGDGLFTLYAVSNTATFQFTFVDGVFVAVIAAGTG